MSGVYRYGARVRGGAGYAVSGPGDGLSREAGEQGKARVRSVRGNQLPTRADPRGFTVRITWTKLLFIRPHRARASTCGFRIHGRLSEEAAAVIRKLAAVPVGGSPTGGIRGMPPQVWSAGRACRIIPSMVGDAPVSGGWCGGREPEGEESPDGASRRRAGPAPTGRERLGVCETSGGLNGGVATCTLLGG